MTVKTADQNMGKTAPKKRLGIYEIIYLELMQFLW